MGMNGKGRRGRNPVVNYQLCEFGVAYTRLLPDFNRVTSECELLGASPGAKKGSPVPEMVFLLNFTR